MSTLVTAKQIAQRENHPSTKERINHIRARFTITHPLAGQKKNNGDLRPVNARVDFGRWLADCECAGAEYVDPDYPFFFCNSCGNSEFNGHPRPVIFPDEKTRAAIESALLERPVDDSRGLDVVEKAIYARPLIRGLARSWDPWESVKDLKTQNRKAGL